MEQNERRVRGLKQIIALNFRTLLKKSPSLKRYLLYFTG
jgi:hypothetical protein